MRVDEVPRKTFPLPSLVAFEVTTPLASAAVEPALLRARA